MQGSIDNNRIIVTEFNKQRGTNDPSVFLQSDGVEFFRYLSLMRDAQVEQYVNKCSEGYTDIIEGRIYDIDPDKQVEIKDYYNVLGLNKNKDVIRKTVFYRVPTSIINQ